MDKEDSIVKILYSPADTFRNQDQLCRYIYTHTEALSYLLFLSAEKKTSLIVCASLFYTVEIDVTKHFNTVTAFVAIYWILHFDQTESLQYTLKVRKTY